MAEDRTRPTREDGRHAPAQLRELAMPHRVHAAVNRAQVHRFEASGDRSAAHAPLQQLMTGDHAMLAIGKLGDREIRAPAPACPPNRIFGTHTVLNIRFAGHGPIVAARL
jgi:hypothetical protein